MKVVDGTGEKVLYTTEHITHISLWQMQQTVTTSKRVECGCCSIFGDFTCRSCWSSVTNSCFSVEGPAGFDMSRELIGGDNEWRLEVVPYK
jgi:hypothetical protein